MLTLNRKDLSAALAAIKPANNRKSALPILAYVKATYTDGALVLCATNLELYAERAVAAHADPAAWPEAGTCLEFAPLEAALKGKADTVTLREDAAGAYVTVGKAIARVPVLDVSDFPPAPTAPLNSPHWLTVDAESFVDTFARVASVTSTDEARPVLTGVHMHIDDKGLHMQAADGSRLMRTRYAPIVHSDIFECNLPARAVKLLEKLTSTTALVVIDPSRNVLHIIGADGERVVSQLIDGGYPDLNQVIPIDPPHRVVFTADAAAEALAPFKASMGILRVVYTDGTLSLAIHNEDHDIETSLPCRLDTETHADMTGYNPVFLKTIIQAAQRKWDVKVVMENTIPTCPAKFTTPDSDPDFVAVLMPMLLD